MNLPKTNYFKVIILVTLLGGYVILMSVKMYELIVSHINMYLVQSCSPGIPAMITNSIDIGPNGPSVNGRPIEGERRYHPFILTKLQ